MWKMTPGYKLWVFGGLATIVVVLIALVVGVVIGVIVALNPRRSSAVGGPSER